MTAENTEEITTMDNHTPAPPANGDPRPLDNHTPVAPATGTATTGTSTGTGTGTGTQGDHHSPTPPTA